MINGKTVVEGSRDRPSRVHTGGERPDTAGGISRRIECGEGAICDSHENTEVPPEGVSRNEFKVGSRDHPLRHDG